MKQLGIFSLFLLFFSTEAFALNIQWNQPEVVSEKLSRNNRRVLRFSATASPGTQVRIRDNKVKMIFSGKKVRWARIPQKHRVQFPVIASDTGYFSFELYLPTTAVEIPLEILKGGKWIPYRFSFEVPDEGAAEDFKFIEESFKSRDGEDSVKVEDFLSEYDRESDQGQVVNDRGEWKSWATGKVFVWGSLGLTYYTLEEKLNIGDDLGAFSGMAFPSWEVGGEYRWNPQWKVDVSYINRAGDVEPDGNYIMQNKSLNWSEARVNLSYFPLSFEKETYRLGFRAGVQMHDIPFVKRVTTQQYRVFNNSVIFLAAGMAYETMSKTAWQMDASAMLIYPVVVDSEFDMESAYGFNLGVSLMKEVIPALQLGGKLDIHWINFEANHPEFSLPSQSITADTNLWQITPSFVLKAEF